MKPLQHTECKNNSSFHFYEKIVPPCRKMAKMRFQAREHGVKNGHIVFQTFVPEKRGGKHPIHENIC